MRPFVYTSDAWVVGSAAKWLLDLGGPPRDWDIMVPLQEWTRACRQIPKGSVTNAFGGAKFTVDGVTIDVWAGDVGLHMAQIQHGNQYSVHIASQTYLISGRGIDR